MDKITKSEEQWKKNLSEEQYKVLREKETEAPFSGIYNGNKDEGTYRCVACDNELFSSDAKFDSGSGWPSFYKPKKEDSVELKEDLSGRTKRTEVLCKNCGSHLGHVFDDALDPSPDAKPGATCNRFCINSVALDFKKK